MAAPLAGMTLVVANPRRNLIFFENNRGGVSGYAVYNYKTQQWTAIPAYDGLRPFAVSNGTSSVGLIVYSAGSASLQTQTSVGATQSVTLTTAAADVNQGGRTVVNGVRPRVNGGTPTVRVGIQDQISDSVTWSTSVSLNSRTGYGNVRAEGRYVRAEVTIPDSFTTAIGADVELSPQGKV